MELFLNSDKVVVHDIFNPSDIEIIWKSTNPSSTVYELVETFLRRKTGKIDYDSNMLLTISEFHIKNLVFLKENFNFPDYVNAKLLNILALLINLKEPIVQKLNRFGSTTETNSTNHEENVNYLQIGKAKLNEIKFGLLESGLIYRENLSLIGDFYLKPKEVEAIVNYIHVFYFPFIKLYYHFINSERITINKKIEIIINKPLYVPPLNLAVKQIQERNEVDEQQIKESNEEIEQKVETVKTEEKKETVVEEKVETYIDIMNKLNLNSETRKIITEKIQELHQEVDFKIVDRQRRLDEKLKEIEQSIKGGKKK